MTRVVRLDYDPTQPRPSPSKYGNQPITVDGIRFASHAEAARYGELVLLMRAGAITDLVTHPRFVLAVNTQVVGSYYADFSYRSSDGLLVVEDTKSPLSKTAVYRLKRKLMRAIWNIEVTEIES